MKQAYVFGAGGHGKVVAGTLLALGWEVPGFADDNRALHGAMFFSRPVLGGREILYSSLPVAMGVGDGQARQRIVEALSNLDWQTVVHAHAWVDSSVLVAQGTVILAGAVVQPDAVLGRFCIINTGATVDHDCRIGDFAHICPGVNLAGNVDVGKGAWVGIGSRVIQGVRIGAGAVIGAGATVLEDVPEGVLAVGTPARVVKRIGEC